MQELAHISIERCLFPEEEIIAESQLHIFGDAAEEAYANVEDVPNQYHSDQIIVIILQASNNLSPKKICRCQNWSLMQLYCPPVSPPPSEAATFIPHTADISERTEVPPVIG